MEILTQHKSNIRYRKAISEDYNAITEFCLDALNEHQLPQFSQDIGEDLIDRVRMKSEINVILAQEVDTEKVVGYMELQEEQINDTHCHVIQGIYVIPQYRGSGVGRNLVKQAIASIGNSEQIRVRSSYPSMVKFWKRNGFNIDFWMLHGPTGRD